MLMCYEKDYCNHVGLLNDVFITNTTPAPFFTATDASFSGNLAKVTTTMLSSTDSTQSTNNNGLINKPLS
ncbi:hypothetical protein DdX_10496 [Ditylenchus destructor]|uniref:Uncharacterized protein n=1 Tax=Ditylenchus destructor TaxID=166010 RepID=A0AAD4N0K1_9BILA|nr:hypothetical protein DdX_10496 [Ditylenchus destructor]